VIAYVDSSVLLRFILDQPDPLSDLLRFDSRVTSLVAEVECLRAVESARSRGQLTGEEAADRRRIVHAQLRRMRRLPVSLPVIRRAGEAYPLPVKSLDAIHLASALMVRDREAPDLVFATHDRRLGRLAAVMDLPVIGL
jgi:predicted nucleic acid-binding protein